jgi:F0F1-type ATP synthase assembly protein I
MNDPDQQTGDPSGPGDPDAGHPRLEEAHMWNVVSYLISGPVMFGGIGWALDRWLGTAFLVPVGILAGMAVSLYLVWFRYGTQQ